MILIVMACLMMLTIVRQMEILNSEIGTVIPSAMCVTTVETFEHRPDRQ